jgi:hypothetical protein
MARLRPGIRIVPVRVSTKEDPLRDAPPVSVAQPLPPPQRSADRGRAQSHAAGRHAPPSPATQQYKGLPQLS